MNPQATGQRTVPEEEEEECGCCGRWGHIFMKMAEGSAEMRRWDRKESKGLTSSLKTTSETTTIIYVFTFRCDMQMQRHFWLVCQSFLSKEDVDCVVNRWSFCHPKWLKKQNSHSSSLWLCRILCADAQNVALFINSCHFVCLCFLQYWHKGCFSCEVCKMTLNMKNYKGFEKKPYCNA